MESPVRFNGDRAFLLKKDASDHKKRARITCILAVGIASLTVGCSPET